MWWVQGTAWGEAHQATLETAVGKEGRSQAVPHEEDFLGSLLFLVPFGMG